MNTTSSQTKFLWMISGYSISSAWTINVWDGLVGFDKEVTFIWPMSHTAYIKWMYLFAKYFALIVQTCVLGVQVGYLANHSMSMRSCRIYRISEMAGVTLLLLCFDIVLLLRIYALYGRRTWSSLIASFAVLVEFATTVASTFLTIPSTIYNPVCVMMRTPKDVLTFVGGTFISQTILLWLAFRKRERVRVVRTRSRASIACVTIRDGVLVFLCIAIILVILFMFALRDSPATTLMIFWFPMVISIATCRIILNIQGTPPVEPTEQQSSIPQELTTQIEGVDRTEDSISLSDMPFPPQSPA